MWPFRKKLGKTEVAATPSSLLPTVEFDRRGVTPAVEAEILDALREVSEIAEQQIGTAHNAALESVARGRDLHHLCAALIALGLTKGRAAEVSRAVNNRATSLMQRIRQQELGITEAIWLHSGAPCLSNMRNPSPTDIGRNSDHLAASGKRYQVSQGMQMGSRRVWPGQEPGCGCISKPVVPGFS